MKAESQIIIAALSGMAISDWPNPVWKMPHLPEKDWKHDGDRLQKAQEKRARKQAKRLEQMK